MRSRRGSGRARAGTRGFQGPPIVPVVTAATLVTAGVLFSLPTPLTGQVAPPSAHPDDRPSVVVVRSGADLPGPGVAPEPRDPIPALEPGSGSVWPGSFRTQEEPVSTRAVFIRAFLVPGWGHVMTESYLRGGFWVAAQGSTWWMLWKSVSRRQEARRLRETEMETVIDRYRDQGVMNPDSLRFLAEGDPAMDAWDTLLDRRDEQVEDWVALSIFVMLLGAVDAFVSAHLMDFPEPLALDVGPRQGVPLDPRRPGVEVRLSVSPSALRSLLSLGRTP